MSATETADLELRRAQEKVSALDDETLVFVMYGMLANSANPHSHVVGGEH